MPADWDEREKIPDPEAVKPEDWDEVTFHEELTQKLINFSFCFYISQTSYMSTDF